MPLHTSIQQGQCKSIFEALSLRAVYVPMAVVFTYNLMQVRRRNLRALEYLQHSMLLTALLVVPIAAPVVHRSSVSSSSCIYHASFTYYRCIGQRCCQTVALNCHAMLSALTLHNCVIINA
jgi:hypothetical protein